MKISLNIIKQYINFQLPPVDELVQRINEQLGGVEEVIDLGAKYKDAKVVRVVECQKHPDADRLQVCQVDDGSGDLVQVVCGAPNVHADMWAVWLPSESIVPSTYGTDEEFTLGARALRGVMSHGMLAAADELDIGSDHDGIVEINPDEWRPSDLAVTPGANFAHMYGLDDTIIDIENKMFTHRPDLFGQLGVAREIAGILGYEFQSPDWYLQSPVFASASELELDVFNDASEKVPRVMFVTMKDVHVRPSPLWLQTALVAMGSKPINNIVDVTNYLMLLTAQPTHAYDYEKIRERTIGARYATSGETLTLLNGKTYELHEDDIVIADGQGAIGLAGIMGGSESEVSHDTKSIVLEVATFDMYAVRKSAMRHGLFTDAVTRFNKGQSPRQNDRIVGQLLAHMTDVSGAAQASDVYDIASDAIHTPHQSSVDVEFINQRLGLEFSAEEVGTFLENVEFSTEVSETIVYTVPFWRTDIELPEDIVEEVGRLNGFAALPQELPRRSAAAAARNPSVETNERIRQLLTRAGGNEVLTYSFVHEQLLKKSQQDPVQAFKLSNALSPHLQYYRLSLVPSLLDKVHTNSKSGYDNFLLYEFGKAHHTAVHESDGLPKELGRIAGVYISTENTVNAPYYHARRTVDFILDDIAPRARATYTRLDEYVIPEFPPFMQMLAPFEPKRSAVVELDGKPVGIVGEPLASVAKGFKLPEGSAMFELFQSPLIGHDSKEYIPLSRYQATKRDVSFVVAEDVRYASILNAAESAHADTAVRIEASLKDIYRQHESSEKTFTLHFVVTPYDRTLSSDEANEIVESVAHAVCLATGARIG